MSQKADAVPALVTPTVKGMGKATAAILISLVSIGAFVGAGVGTYVTFRYVILPSFQGSNGLSDNGCSSATFQSGTTYSWTFGDTNGHSFSGFSLKY